MTGRVGWTLVVALLGLLLFAVQGVWWVVAACACVFGFVLGRWIGMREGVDLAVRAVQARARAQGTGDVRRAVLGGKR